MKIKKQPTTKIVIPSHFFEDEDKEYWIETAPLNTYQTQLLRIQFLHPSTTAQEIQNGNVHIDLQKLAEKDYYFLAIAVRDTNLVGGWRELEIEQRIQFLKGIDEDNPDLIAYLVEEVKKITGEVV